MPSGKPPCLLQSHLSRVADGRKVLPVISWVLTSPLILTRGLLSSYKKASPWLLSRACGCCLALASVCD
ncbi:hypothetical protein VULLAG_LOCUS6481 [Vulpes lagopus]